MLRVNMRLEGIVAFRPETTIQTRMQRIRVKEGLLKPEFNQSLDQWLEKMKNEPSE